MRMNKFFIMFFVGLLLVGAVSAADKYVTITGAGSHNGQPGNEWTLREAVTNVQPGDTVHLAIGNYDQATSLNFNKAGTASQPITWIGVIDQADFNAMTVSADATKSTVINSDTASNYEIGIGGDYNVFKNLVFQQNANQKGLIQLNGNYVTFDHVATKYPPNGGSSSAHFMLVFGHHVTLRHSTFNQGARTIIWVRKGSGSQADYFLMEYCTLKGATNHPPIQIMPTTNADTGMIQRPIVRNNLFIDNSYSNIYSRYVYQFAYYNNLFIRSGSPMDIDINTGNYVVGDSNGGFAAYNTIIENSQSANIIYNNGLNGIKFVNNLYYSTGAWNDPSVMVLRFSTQYNTIFNQQVDYNLYYYSEMSDAFTTQSNKLRGTWGSAYTSVWYKDWVRVTGQDVHTIVNQVPTFMNPSADNYAPLSASSPQVGKGIPITQANGFWMDVTTDYFGNPRDPVHPTLGAIELGSTSSGGGSGGGGSGSPPIVVDTNMDGCISLGEISTYVGRWLSGSGVTLSQTSSAISTWMSGC